MNADIVIITALASEHEAVCEALDAIGVSLEPEEQSSALPYLAGKLPISKGYLSICLARPTRMGATATAPVAAALAQHLRPRCLAMCGVCAGNPSDVALGDVIIAECVYSYDEGKKTVDGFEGDHRQIPLADKWLRIAQDLTPKMLPTYGAASKDDAQIWLLEQLNNGGNPRIHPARTRYLGGKKWARVIKELEHNKLVRRTGKDFIITAKGRNAVEQAQAYDLDSPSTLPFAIQVGPIASGSVVVKDGLTWDMLKSLGVRTVLGLEMEASSIAQVAQRLEVPNWVVVKGVMDYANPNKDDRIKNFAARASADVLLHFLQTVAFDIKNITAQKNKENVSSTLSTNTVGDVNGSNINITQNFDYKKL